MSVRQPATLLPPDRLLPFMVPFHGGPGPLCGGAASGGAARCASASHASSGHDKAFAVKSRGYDISNCLGWWQTSRQPMCVMPQCARSIV